jgi:PIN domain nuclease of toxin-antitoxin system
MGCCIVILLDTHAWIWWVSESPKLSEKARMAIETEDFLGVSAISCWETAMLYAKQRIRFNLDIEEWIDLAEKRPKIQVLPLTPKVAVLSTRLPGDFHGDPADRIIAATSLSKGIALVTRDEKIIQWDQITTIW